MSNETRITSKGQIALPRPVREKLGWRPGTRLRIDMLRDGSVRLRPTPDEDPIERAFGCLAFGYPVGDLA